VLVAGADETEVDTEAAVVAVDVSELVVVTACVD
jgi:hypothetical protein